MCYGTKIEKQPLNELENDDEQSMRKKEEIDAIEEKIRALTEEKAKREKEYRYLCNVNNFENLLKDDSSTNY